MKKEKFYKNKYFIVFYDKDDENFLYLFNNVHEILKFQNKEINHQNVNLINVEIYRALKREGNFCKFLTGETMVIHIYDVEDEE